MNFKQFKINKFVLLVFCFFHFSLNAAQRVEVHLFDTSAYNQQGFQEPKSLLFMSWLVTNHAVISKIYGSFPLPESLKFTDLTEELKEKLWGSHFHYLQSYRTENNHISVDEILDFFGSQLNTVKDYYVPPNTNAPIIKPFPQGDDNKFEVIQEFTRFLFQRFEITNSDDPTLDQMIQFRNGGVFPTHLTFTKVLASLFGVELTIQDLRTYKIIQNTLIPVDKNPSPLASSLLRTSWGKKVQLSFYFDQPQTKIKNPFAKQRNPSRQPKRQKYQPKSCAHCGVTKTPEWRNDDKERDLCNACGLYFQKMAKKDKETSPHRDSLKPQDLLNQSASKKLKPN